MRVDLDTLDKVMQRISPKVRVPAGELDIQRVDDFHPDHLFRKLEIFQGLQRSRTNPPAENPAAEDIGRLLGRRAEVSASSAPRLSGIEALIQQAVAPHVVKDTSAETRGYLGAIDAAMADQMRTLLHDPAFTSLESAWRGVQWLIANLELDGGLSLHIFDVTRDELLEDIVSAQGKLAQTGLHRALVDRWRNEPGAPGWNALVALFDFGPSDRDVGLLAALGLIASQAGGPILAGADLALAGDDERTLTSWHTLRQSEAAKWIGLAAPRVLLRMPYGKASDPIESFAFEECLGPPGPNDLLWGPASLATALLLGQSFNASGWEMEPGDVREIDGLPAYTFERDGEREMQPCAERLISESTINTMVAAGLIPIASRRDRGAVVAVRFQSIADPPAPLNFG
jgi:type VI secretion system protein ImpC